jgi:putative DNA primase/helicase
MDSVANITIARKSRRARTHRETVHGDEAHVIDALRERDELKGMLLFDELRQRVVIAKPPPWDGMELHEPWSDVCTTELMSHLQRHGYSIRGRGVVDAAVAVVARDRKRHPVREFLQNAKLLWDKRERLSGMFADYFDAQGDADYLASISRAFLTSAVARTLRPGCKVDTLPVLEGPQGAGKSQSVRVLGSPWVNESLPALSDPKEAALALRGVWFVELSELAAMTRAEVESIKAFISRQVDDIREPYARHTASNPRQCVMVGTTNAATYLRDHTGNRRFWPVRCGSIDLAALERDRLQLFGEAVHAFEAGEQWHLTDEAEALARNEQERRRYVTELEVDCIAYLDRMRSQGYTEVVMRGVIEAVGGIRCLENPREAGAIGAQLAGIMARNGWQPGDVIGRGARRRNLWRYAGE